MKFQIRSNIFETNSSSIHSLAIPKKCRKKNHFVFHIGEFGWTFENADPCDYFYTAIFETSTTMDEVNSKIKKLKKILDKNKITYQFEDASISKSKNNDYIYLDYGYIDHGSQLKYFVQELLNNSNLLLNFLSGGHVFCGNDNSYDDGYYSRDKKFIQEYDFDIKQTVDTDKENPYFMDNYNDYFWYEKGN